MESTVAARVRGPFVQLPAAMHIGAARAALPEGGWAVITGEKSVGIGLVSQKDLEDHDEAATLAVVARALPPLVVVAADVPAIAAVEAPAFRFVEPGRAVLVERDGVVTGVWDGDDLVKTLLAYGIGGERGVGALYGKMVIAKVRRQCGYQQAGRSCTAIETVPEPPEDPRECGNHEGLADHRFVWS
jgi:hypothetical protein